MQMHRTRKQTMTTRRHFMNVSTRLAVAVALAGSAGASFGGWAKADKEHFSDGGAFDQIYVRK